MGCPELSHSAAYPPGPATVSSNPLDSILPSSVQMAPWLTQSVVAGSTMATLTDESGVTVISHRTLPGGSSRRVLVTLRPSP